MTWLNNLSAYMDASDEQSAATERFKHSIEDFAELDEGSRNETLNKLAYRAGILIAKGWVAQDWAEFKLEEACESNGLIPDDGIDSFRATLNSGITSGKEQGPLGDNSIKSLVMSSEELKHLPAVKWTIEGLLMPDSLAFVAGEGGSGKSFMCIDLVGSIACRTHWQGKKIIKNQKCLYVAAEGKAGLRDRVKAWESYNGTHMTNVDFVPYPVRYGSQEWQDLKAYAETARPGVIVIDTLAACVSGGLDENSNTEMSRFTGDLLELKKASGATILVVHHTSKMGGMRGASALGDNSDTVILLNRTEDKINVFLQKQKESEGGQLGKFFLKSEGPSAVFLRTDAQVGVAWDL